MVPDPVAVDLAARREARVEGGSASAASISATSGGKIEFKARSRPMAGMREVRLKLATWPVGVNAGVGAPGAAHFDALADDGVDAVLQRSLHGSPAGLPLPAREVGAVVLDDEAQLAGRLVFGHRACPLKLEHQTERPGVVADVQAVLSGPGPR